MKAIFCWNEKYAYTDNNENDDKCVGGWDDTAEVVGPYKTLDAGDQNDEWNVMRIEYYDRAKTPLVRVFGAVGFGFGHAGLLPVGNYELQT